MNRNHPGVALEAGSFSIFQYRYSVSKASIGFVKTGSCDPWIDDDMPMNHEAYLLKLPLQDERPVHQN